MYVLKQKFRYVYSHWISLKDKKLKNSLLEEAD